MRRYLLTFLLLVLAFEITACANRKKIDWNSRVGSYTYDDAVIELGPPDKSSTLTDGALVAEWLEQRSSGGGISFGFGTGVSRGGVGVGLGHVVGSPRGDDFLRLTFDPQRKLQAWIRYER